ncbi:MAG: hypothetical protein HUJ27_12845 [Rhodobacteraceae bacterium]|nr:hypothetical protein [Paracoccaceae bacterium]
MMIARWHVMAKFGHKQEVIDLLKEWNSTIGAQTDVDMSKARVLSGSVGSKEAMIVSELEIADLAELGSFFDKIAAVQPHKDWGRKLSDLVVSGSSYWDVYRVVP